MMIGNIFQSMDRKPAAYFAKLKAQNVAKTTASNRQLLILSSPVNTAGAAYLSPPRVYQRTAGAPVTGAAEPLFRAINTISPVTRSPHRTPLCCCSTSFSRKRAKGNSSGQYLPSHPGVPCQTSRPRRAAGS
jgi:hypothetical protein